MKVSIAAAAAVLACSCSSTVLVQVPPRMQLDRAQTIGIVAFEVADAAGGAPNVSTRFVEAIQHGQPGVAVVELGSSAALLGAVGRSELDRDALREIGRKYELDAVLVGALRMHEQQPRLDVDLDQGFELGAVRAQVRLDGNLEAKLVDTERGATVWSGSSARWIELASVSGDSAGFGSVSVADRQRQVERLVGDMIAEASADFRPSYERRRVD
ncbi:MAG: hypothetical protein EPO68_03610 [Planctomycetota bacterium]|nr:MAG: hypothetical protein EPO68_03610 [Planctomycetota bacterium]